MSANAVRPWTRSARRRPATRALSPSASVPEERVAARVRTDSVGTRPGKFHGYGSRPSARHRPTLRRRSCSSGVSSVIVRVRPAEGDRAYKRVRARGASSRAFEGESFDPAGPEQREVLGHGRALSGRTRGLVEDQEGPEKELRRRVAPADSVADVVGKVDMDLAGVASPQGIEELGELLGSLPGRARRPCRAGSGAALHRPTRRRRGRSPVGDRGPRRPDGGPPRPVSFAWRAAYPLLVMKPSEETGATELVDRAGPGEERVRGGPSGRGRPCRRRGVRRHPSSRR